MLQNNGEPFVSERRKDLHELADSIQCLRTEFQDAMKQLRDDIDWREKEAKPIMTSIRRASNIMIGASGMVSILAAIVVWVFLRSYSQLQDASSNTTLNSRTLSTIAVLLEKNDKTDDRQDLELKDLREHDYRDYRRREK